ncbi:MAG: O-antigen ligase family protein [Rhodospirillales bacterium]|nr:O-antigen ligase family protein [Rhodospirillales bacterium]
MGPKAPALLHARAHASLAWLAVAGGCVGILVSSTGGIMAALGAALFLALWAIVIGARGPGIWSLWMRQPGLLALPVLAVVSVVWSAYPAASARAGAQLLLTAMMGVLAARLLPPRAFVSAVVTSLALGALLCLAFGRYVLDPLTGAAPFVGIFAAKNSMAFFMALLVIFGAAAALDRAQSSAVRLLGGAALLLAMPLLVLARSAGALVTTVLALGMLVGGLMLGRMRRAERGMLAAGGLLVAIPFLLLLAMLALGGTLGEVARDFIVRVLGKDLTLTGRTELWAHAWVQITREPWLGQGYQAFWQQGNPWAEGLWRQFHITGRSGFHFHNTFIDTAVTLGLVGAAGIAWLLLMGVFRTLRRVLVEPNFATASLFATATCLLARAFVEVDTTYPFAIGTFLLFAINAYGHETGLPTRR